MMLVNSRGRPTYLLSKNPQIKLGHRRLGYVSNTRIIEVFKLNDKIEIMIEDDHLTEDLPFDLEMDEKDKYEDLGQTLIADHKHERLSPLMAIINDPNSSEIEKLCDLCIESKYTKIVRYKKLTPTTRKLQKIHADLWELHDPLLLLEKTYIGLLLDEFI